MLFTRPVHEVLAFDLDDREQAGHGRRREDRPLERSFGEPVFGRRFDAGRYALEREGELLEPLDRECAADQ
jgi:hypothetical protein